MNVACLMLAVVFVPRTANSFLLEDEPGHCVWYGECGTGPNAGPLNCPYNGTARLLSDVNAQKILKEYCPSLYKGDDTYTCCSPSQLVTLSKNMALPRQLLSRCPACYQNFLNIYCPMICDPHQSIFLRATWTKPVFFIPKQNQGIPAVDYVVSDDFAWGMFNSCKTVQMPSAGAKALSLFCGRKAEDCTPYNLLAYMGSTDNGQAPFDIRFIIQNKPWVSPDQKSYLPMNVSTFKCNESYQDLPDVCSCQDCKDSCAPPIPSLKEPITIARLDGIPVRLWSPTVKEAKMQKDYLNRKLGLTYRTEQVIITRKNQTRVRHQFPPPSVRTIEFASVFDRDFMHQVLQLQQKITYLTVPFRDGYVTLNDVCFKPAITGQSKASCSIDSVLQYWQNNATKLDAVAWDEYHFFTYGNYLDHLLSCVNYPGAKSDATKLNMTCISETGNAVLPWVVLGGYDGLNYHNATTFIIMFTLENHANGTDNDRVKAWEAGFLDLMKNYNNPNMTVVYSSDVGVISTIPSMLP